MSELDALSDQRSPGKGSRCSYPSAYILFCGMNLSAALC